jgi:hypothetical protein
VKANKSQLQAGHAKTLAQWTNQYGDIFEVDLGGRVAVGLTVLHVKIAF